MPVYEYRCEACEHQFELRQKFADPPASECPACGGAVHKMISSTAFSLKGGGWHAEGYGANSKTSAPPACPSGGSCAGCPSAAA
ncbi:MAG TPA: zinc ribbon domain-containing protein [Geobacteraceae bacterium]